MTTLPPSSTSPLRTLLLRAADTIECGSGMRCSGCGAARESTGEPSRPASRHNAGCIVWELRRLADGDTSALWLAAAPLRLPATTPPTNCHIGNARTR